MRVNKPFTITRCSAHLVRHIYHQVITFLSIAVLQDDRQHCHLHESFPRGITDSVMTKLCIFTEYFHSFQLKSAPHITTHKKTDVFNLLNHLLIVA